MSETVIDRHDVQALLKAGYGALSEGVYLLAWVKDAAKARAWLASHPPTAISDLDGGVDRARHVAISAPGLAALGVADEVIERFAPEFVSGMAAEPSRSRRLGDVGANAPDLWAWGKAGDEPHALVMLFARPGALAGFLAETADAGFAAAFRWSELSTSIQDRREPFGFVDGLSQPALDWAAERTPNTADDLAYGNLIAAGEFVLGYANEYGLVTRTPTLEPEDDAGRALPRDAGGRPDLGRNGSYLVFRQMRQDVKGFWAFADAHGGLALAEAMVGRRRDGEPLVRTGERPILGVAEDQVAANGFDFESDTEGLSCPFSGHIRRANPRSGDMPGGAQIALRKVAGMLGFGVDRRADTVASSRFHRLLRRGRKYGSPGAEEGLHFISLGASIARQFEFVQAAWIHSPRFAGLTGEQDPILGTRDPFPEGFPTDAFRRPEASGPCAELSGLPQFVTVTGGAYFFLPGLRALRWIAGGRGAGLP